LDILSELSLLPNQIQWDFWRHLYIIFFRWYWYFICFNHVTSYSSTNLLNGRKIHN